MEKNRKRKRDRNSPKVFKAKSGIVKKQGKLFGTFSFLQSSAKFLYFCIIWISDTSILPFVISDTDGFVSFIRFAKYIFSAKQIKNKSHSSIASLRFA